jgi:hypothetical protein
MPEKEFFELQSTSNQAFQPGTGFYTLYAYPAIFCGQANADSLALGEPQAWYFHNESGYPLECYWDEIASGYTGCSGCSDVNTSNQATSATWGNSLHTRLGFVQPYRCNNFYVRSGEYKFGSSGAKWYLKANDADPDPAPIAGGDCYGFIPQNTGLQGQVTVYRTLTDRCKNIFGTQSMCLDTSGGVIACSPKPAGYSWELMPSTFQWVGVGGNQAGSTGGCIREIRLYQGAFLAQSWNEWIGCPDGLTETEVTLNDVGLTSGGDPLENATWVLSHSDSIGRSGAAAMPRYAERISDGTRANQNWYTLTTYAVNPSNYGASLTHATAPKPGCYLPKIGNHCPLHTHDNGLTPMGCLGDTVSPSCLSPYTYVTSIPEKPLLTGPYCRRDYTQQISAGSMMVGRSPFGRLFTGLTSGFRRYTDARPETVLDTKSPSGPFTVRKSGVIDVFVIGYSSGNEWLDYYISEDNGATFQTPNRLYSNTISSRGILITSSYSVYFNEGGFVLLVYYVPSESAWKYRVLRKGTAKMDWDLGAEYLLASGLNTGGHLQIAKDGSAEFTYFDSSANAVVTRCRKFNIENALVWEWITGSGNPTTLFNGNPPAEYHTICTYHDWNKGLKLVIAWHPNQTGKVQNTDWTNLGDFYVIPYTLDENMEWISAGSSYAIVNNVIPQAGNLRKEKDGTWVLRLLSSGVWRCRNPKSDGSGDWVQD